MLNSSYWDIEDPTENEVYLLNDMTINRSNKRKIKYKYFCITLNVLTILLIIGLQIVCFLYLYSIINAIEKLNINQINITKSLNYINKTETIIDFICDNYIKC